MEKQGEINVYNCTANEEHKTVTIVADDGTTPFMIGCSICGASARSSFYMVQGSPEPTFEWFKPKSTTELKTVTKREAREAGLTFEELYSANKDHWKMGGLFLRKIKKQSYGKRRRAKNA